MSKKTTKKSPTRETTVLYVRDLPIEVADKVRAYAKARGLKMSGAIRELVERV